MVSAGWLLSLRSAPACESSHYTTLLSLHRWTQSLSLNVKNGLTERILTDSVDYMMQEKRLELRPG